MRRTGACVASLLPTTGDAGPDEGAWHLPAAVPAVLARRFHRGCADAAAGTGGERALAFRACISTYQSPTTRASHRMSLPARPRSLAQTTHEALCDSVEHARGCVRRASSMPPFCLLRAMVGNASARRVCQQLCRLYLQGEFDGSLTKPLERLARHRWPQPRPVTQKGAVRP